MNCYTKHWVVFVIQGHLLSRGLRVQQHRVRELQRRIDPCGTKLCHLHVIDRQTYKVRAPRSLYHLKSNDKTCNSCECPTPIVKFNYWHYIVYLSLKFSFFKGLDAMEFCWQLLVFLYCIIIIPIQRLTYEILVYYISFIISQCCTIPPLKCGHLMAILVYKKIVGYTTPRVRSDECNVQLENNQIMPFSMLPILLCFV